MQEVIDLYKDYATHEQCHSEFETDINLERLTSGKFDVDFLVCALAMVAMNILRLIGQNALIGKDATLCHAAKRRRIKTVMLDIMFDIPSREDVTTCRITKDVIEKVCPPLLAEGTGEKKAVKKPKQSA